MNRSPRSAVFAGFVLLVGACSSSADGPDADDDASGEPSASTLAAGPDGDADPPPATTATTEQPSPPSTTEPAPSTTTEPTPEPVDPAELAVPPIAWEACVDFDRIECGTLTAPLDYADPDGTQIELAVGRSPAADPDARIGSVLLNPGGPGASGLDFLETAALLIPDEIRAAFDLVSFDPRGVGASSSIVCTILRDDGVELVGDDDRIAWDALFERTASEIESCEFDVEGLGAFVGTNNAARDLDLIRAAVGDEKLSYIGFSYGTRLGATYAELFPERVRALVLDGAVEPSTDFAALDRAQAMGLARALTNFSDACDADADCVLSDLGPALDVITSVRDGIGAAGSFDAFDGRVLTPGELDLGVIATLYDRRTWPILAEAVRLATSGDGELFQVLADSYLGRESDGSYDNGLEARAFINCADDPTRPTPDEAWADADATGDEAAWFAELLRADVGCSGIAAAVDPLLVGPAQGAPPILVIGTTGDPATPYKGAVAMADFLDSGVLFTVEGEGHTAYTSVECVAPVVHAYLLDLTVPDDRSSCSDDVGADLFLPPGESEIDQVIAFFACLRDEGLELDEVTVAELLRASSADELFADVDISDPSAGAAVLACQSLISGP